MKSEGVKGVFEISNGLNKCLAGLVGQSQMQHTTSNSAVQRLRCLGGSFFGITFDESHCVESGEEWQREKKG